MEDLNGHMDLKGVLVEFDPEGAQFRLKISYRSLRKGKGNYKEL